MLFKSDSSQAKTSRLWLSILLISFLLSPLNPGSILNSFPLPNFIVSVSSDGVGFSLVFKYLGVEFCRASKAFFLLTEIVLS